MVDVEASVVKILGNKHKSKGTSSSSKIIIRDFRIAPLKLNLTIDKVRAEVEGENENPIVNASAPYKFPASYSKT